MHRFNLDFWEELVKGLQEILRNLNGCAKHQPYLRIILVIVGMKKEEYLF